MIWNVAMPRMSTLSLLVCFSTFIMCGFCLGQETPTEPTEPAGADAQVNPFPGRFAAEDFGEGAEWLNTKKSYKLSDFKGKVVLLDFWTYCCINCMHVLPDLEYLEEKYPNELVVVGVHSAKFENEKGTDAIRQAIMRYEISHPVVNDAEMTIWRKYGVSAWPTLVVIDPEGKYVGYLSGEGNRQVMDKVVGDLVTYHKAQGTLNERPIDFELERERAEPTPLRYPGKVLADAASNRLFIADSNHNRILITTLDGELLETIGTGIRGADNGAYDEASFFRPQGMALVGSTLYVADTENHLLRMVNLDTKTVSTLAGIGQQGRFGQQGGTLRETALNSPWALTVLNGTLYIAMAGPHQLWSHELGSGTINVFAGTGREDIIDAPLLESALAQPSAITTDGAALYFVDSEGSAVRKATLGAQGALTTIAGPHDLPRGASLFAFDDIDGIGDKARFQHPLGLVFHDGKLIVADSYNHKLKTVDPATGATKTLWGTGAAGAGLEPLQFSEPGGLSVADNFLYVADTNNHRILKISLADNSVELMKIEGLKPPQVEAE